MVRAKKSLGQNFLRSEKALLDIVHAGQIEKNETVLEIGPGEGVLTKKLLESGASVIAVEKDDILAEKLNQLFKKEISEKKLKLIHGDIIEVSDKIGLKKNKYKLVANIPYYLTGMIIRTFISFDMLPERSVLLVQKEVAERIVAKDKKQSVLSVIVSLFCDSQIISVVKRGSFAPAPKVDSAIICMWPIKKSFIKNTEHEKKCAHIVKTGFAHKRKVLLKNLEEIFERDTLETVFNKLDLEKNTRAEDLTKEEWKYLLDELV